MAELRATHVEAIRLFGLNHKHLLLTSLNQQIWLPGENVASVCSLAPSHGHVKPAFNCTCGIWSCFSRAGLVAAYPSLVMGLKPAGNFAFFNLRPIPGGRFFTARIKQWGTVIEHEWGYRSEYAEIIPETIQTWPRYHSRPQRRITQHLREKYSVAA